MNPHDRRRAVNVAHHQRDQAFGLLSIVFAAGARLLQHAFKAENAEWAPTRRELGFGNLFDALKRHSSILLGADLADVAAGPNPRHRWYQSIPKLRAAQNSIAEGGGGFNPRMKPNRRGLQPRRSVLDLVQRSL